MKSYRAQTLLIHVYDKISYNEIHLHLASRRETNYETTPHVNQGVSFFQTIFYKMIILVAL